MKVLEQEHQGEHTGTAAMPEILEVAWRRKWLMVGCVVLSLSLAWLYCIVTPKQYRSETLILVEDQKIPEQYVQGVVEGNLEQRIFVIQKQMTSRALLGEIVKEFNLYPDIVAESGFEAATAMLARSLMVEMVAKGPRGNFVGRSSIDAFTVSFAHQDPTIAMKVTGSLASRFIEENSRTRERAAEGTTEFFDEEVRRAKIELEKKEDQISRFKASHVGELPQQVEANLRALDRLQSDINAGNENGQRLSDRLVVVDKAIQDYEKFGTKNPLLAVGPTATDPLFQRLRELREKLVRLQAEFWESYPEVVLTKEEIHHVEEKLTELYGPDVFKPGEKLVDPYQQDLKRQRAELRTEIALVKQRQALLHSEKKNHEKRVDKSPEVEQELLILERDYENMKNNYRSLLDKRLNARVSENLEKRQQGAQFRLLDTANFPTKPETPNQPRVLIFGFLFGCTMGLGISLLKEKLNPQFRHPEEIEKLLGPQLLAVIPDFSFEYDRLSWYNRIGWRELLPGSTRTIADPDVEDNMERAIIPRRQNDKKSGDQPFDSFVVKWFPNSSVAEQYRVAATRLALVRGKGPSTVVAVTSAVKGEGKTTTVINLGYTMARDLGKRTLLLDCDFICPMLHKYAETIPRWGLADCLVDDIPLDDCLTRFKDAPCWIMPVGSSTVRSTELLKSQRLAGILEQVRGRFEYILINAPPVLPLAAMNILAGHADLLLLIVRASSTPKEVVKRALNSLPTNAPAHVILNAVENQSLPSYMGSYEYLDR